MGTCPEKILQVLHYPKKTMCLLALGKSPQIVISRSQEFAHADIRKFAGLASKNGRPTTGAAILSLIAVHFPT
jgi:hypothetical protein